MNVRLAVLGETIMKTLIVIDDDALIRDTVITSYSIHYTKLYDRVDSLVSAR